MYNNVRGFPINLQRYVATVIVETISVYCEACKALREAHALLVCLVTKPPPPLKKAICINIYKLHKTSQCCVVCRYSTNFESVKASVGCVCFVPSANSWLRNIRHAYATLCCCVPCAEQVWCGGNLQIFFVFKY